MAELSRSQILKNPEVLGAGSSGAQITLRDGDESNSMTLKAPDSISTDFTLTFPNSDGASGQYLQTDGSGVLSWVEAGFASPDGAEGYIQYYGAGDFTGAAGVTTDGTHLTLKATGEVRFADTDSSNYVAFKSPGSVAANRTYTLPAFIGSDGQVLKIAAGSSTTAATLEWADDISATGTLIASGDAGAIQLSNGDAGFTNDIDLSFDTTTNTLNTVNITATGAVSVTGALSGGSLTVDNISVNTNTISASTGDIILDPATTNPVSIAGGSPLRLYGSTTPLNYVGLAVPATITADYTLTLPAAIGAADDILAIDGTGQLSFINNYRTINFIIDGGGVLISTGQKGHVVVDFDCTILSWTILADVAGTITVDVWKSNYTNFSTTVPGSGDSMVGGGTKPAISTGNKNQSLSPNWTTLTITAGDILAFNVDSITSINRCTLSLKVKLT